MTHCPDAGNPSDTLQQAAPWLRRGLHSSRRRILTTWSFTTLQRVVLSIWELRGSAFRRMSAHTRWDGRRDERASVQLPLSLKLAWGFHVLLGKLQIPRLGDSSYLVWLGQCCERSRGSVHWRARGGGEQSRSSRLSIVAMEAELYLAGGNLKHPRSPSDHISRLERRATGLLVFSNRGSIRLSYFHHKRAENGDVGHSGLSSSHLTEGDCGWQERQSTDTPTALSLWSTELFRVSLFGLFEANCLLQHRACQRSISFAQRPSTSSIMRDTARAGYRRGQTAEVILGDGFSAAKHIVRLKTTKFRLQGLGCG